jgi:hypothetical protein
MKQTKEKPSAYLAHEVDAVERHASRGLVNGAKFDEGKVFVQVDLTGKDLERVESYNNCIAE